MSIPPDIFDIIDKKDTEDFLNYFTDDASFQFANSPVVKGKKNIRAFLENFFNSIASLQHTILDTWQHSDSVIFRGIVTYTRLNHTKLTVPFVTIIKSSDEGIKEYLIYIDASQLYN